MWGWRAWSGGYTAQHRGVHNRGVHRGVHSTTQGVHSPHKGLVILVTDWRNSRYSCRFGRVFNLYGLQHKSFTTYMCACVCDSVEMVGGLSSWGVSDHQDQVQGIFFSLIHLHLYSPWSIMQYFLILLPLKTDLFIVLHPWSTINYSANRVAFE